MRDNRIQFAAVREDPRPEMEVIQRRRARRVLLIASGGCTALALRQRFADLRITAIDPNPDQLDLVRRKLAALRGDSLDVLAFGVERDDPRGLSACGNFESLFRGLRDFIYELVAPRQDFLDVFEARTTGADLVRKLGTSPYWPVAFQMFFSDGLLHAMFTEAATQHAQAGSYPEYFRSVCERGLTRADAPDNPFLHHIFLGHYLARKTAWPVFLREWSGPLEGDIELVPASFPQVPDLADMDVVSLSNICDWMAPEQVREVAEVLERDLAPGAVVILRQLNNQRDLAEDFRGFEFDDPWGKALLQRDQSLFYCRIRVGTRR